MGTLKGKLAIKLFKTYPNLKIKASVKNGGFLLITYVVVVFSILGQGLTVESLVKKLYKTKTAD